MTPENRPAPHHKCALATGKAEAARLDLLDQIVGPATRQLQLNLGIRPGWRVADIGCRNGPVAAWAAGQVAPMGRVSAVDVSREQLQEAKRKATAFGVRNISFHAASAYKMDLPARTLELVHSRFLLCHLTNPLAALREMPNLLKPGGVLVCEDFNPSSIRTELPARAYRRLFEISRTLDAQLGVDS
jgi:ubiquinone/menaquinone biosynthesis C-methylase UbiE